MKVIRAKVLGFCMGVRRAVDIAQEAINSAKCSNAQNPITIYTLGPLIHNPQVLKSLAEQGVQILEEQNINKSCFFPSCSLPENNTVIIRAHGVSPEIEKALCEKGITIIDATCPKVKKNQTTAHDLAEKGYRIFLAGEKDHAEIQGIYGYVKRKTACIIVGNSEEAQMAALQEKEHADKQDHNPVKTALIGQTTISDDEYQAIAQTLKTHFNDLEIIDTMCKATRDRQDALKKLCSKADAIIVAGGKESANTRHLLTIARDCGKPAWFAEKLEDLPTEFMAFKTIGLCAGASTPDSVIDQIEHALLRN